MLRITLIDDELAALKNMAHILSGLPGVSIAGMYTAPEKALAAIEKDWPDAVFVDIEMPGKNGLELAGELADKHPQIKVVFVTAYNRYAVDAFEASAVDYLLKPVRRERLEKTLARLTKIEERAAAVDSVGGAGIRCLGKFAVFTPSGAPLSFRTKKTEELMALLVHFRSKPLTKEKIIEALWQDIDTEKANVLFHTTLYNLKKALVPLGGGAELQKTPGGHILNILDTPCDAWELERRLGGDNAGEIFAAYTGAYFEEDAYPWADSKRLEFQNAVTEKLMKAALTFEGRGEAEKAAETLEKLLRIDELNDTAASMLLALYRKLGNAAKLRQAQDRYMKIRSELGIN